LLGGIALFLGRGTTTPSVIEPTAAAAPRRLNSQIALAAGLATASVLVVFFYSNTRSSVREDRPVPDLLALLPTTSSGWQVATTTDLYQFASQLRTDHLAERSYSKQTAAGLVEVRVYLAYWRSGQASVSQVASHTPDACWPGAGWQAIPKPVVRERLTVGGRGLAEAESRFFKAGDFPQYVWFWHIYDGRPISYESPYSPKALLQIAWRYGFRHDGDQLFVRLSSNVPWPAIADEPLLAEVFAQTRALGL
jgi:hypothetical protein